MPVSARLTLAPSCRMEKHMPDSANNRLLQLIAYGQSPWLDNISRRLITTGELRTLIDNGLRGVTSNPTIFDKAIASSADYDDQIWEVSNELLDSEQLFEELAIRDLTDACDAFRGVYDAANGLDGFVSIEVSPLLASDTAATIAAARRLNARINRPNLLVKIPATPEGLAAIEQGIADGININITLIFSLEAYEQVAYAYIAGLERRVLAGQPIDRLNSVASFFVSRVDTAVDKRLDALLAAAPDAQARAKLTALKGKAGIANSKEAYARFERIFNGQRFQNLVKHGATVQRVLWASTSVKNPAYPELMYVDALVGAATINTMPPATLEAYKTRGTPVATAVQEGLPEVRQQIADLESLGIHMDVVTNDLLNDGVKLFAESYHSLLKSLETKRRAKPAGQALHAAGVGE